MHPIKLTIMDKSNYNSFPEWPERGEIQSCHLLFYVWLMYGQNGEYPLKLLCVIDFWFSCLISNIRLCIKRERLSLSIYS